ncbi:MAG: DUF3426 domain-containing protein [Pyrinomonadaceae bacterium MAG19_C2-C3]|nr:DUF3426 domain-containing protein [Pyrinomonadaceae bacterium MAG19_C2-C3]
MARPTTDEPEDNLRQKVFIICGIIAALLFAVILFFLLRPASNTNRAALLDGAIREGTPQFEPYRESVRIDSVEATESPRALGDIVMVLSGTARNFTNRTINGLEVRASVVDINDTPVKQRTEIIIPTRQATLLPNKTMPVKLMIEGIPQSANRANIKMEVTGVRFE